MKYLFVPALLGSTAFALPATAQDHSGHDGHQEQPASPAKPEPHDHSGHAGHHPQPAKPEDHSGHAGHMDHSGHKMPGTKSDVSPMAFAEGSGTARLPGAEGGMHGLHLSTGDWMVMTHGNASLQYTDHKGPRGDDMVYVTSMMMLAAERKTGWGRIQFKSMLSLEPLMAPPGHPNLFATGETAYGEPIVDRQHPHDFFMELAARVDIDAGADTLFVYGGPVGEPAVGPAAFMHRGSAKYNPEPPITHHWFDSTHITYGVVTVGYSAPKWQLEASAFRGREPDEERWGIETPKLDSWSVRATLTPTPNWAVQASFAKLKEPEATHPGDDEERFTASVHYSGGPVSAMGAFSSKKKHHGGTLTAWLGEVNWNLDKANTLFGRVENVDNNELFPDHADPLHEVPFRVTKFQAGYARRIAVGPFELALGGSLAAFAKPDALDAAYGNKPWGYTLFARFSLGH